MITPYNTLAEQYSKCEGFSLEIALCLLSKYSVTGLKTLMPLPHCQPVVSEPIWLTHTFSPMLCTDYMHMYLLWTVFASRDCPCLFFIGLGDQFGFGWKSVSIFSKHHHRSYQLLFDRSWWPWSASMSGKSWWCGGHSTTAIWSTPLKNNKH